MALGPGLIGVLMAHRERQDADRVAADGAWQDTGLVFTRADGSGWAPDTVSYWFQKLAKEAGLRRVRFHDLRHGTASLALANGVDMAVVSKMLGHSTLAFTVDRYTHLLEGTGRRAAIAVETGVPRAAQRSCDQSVTNTASDEISAKRARSKSPGQRPVDQWGGWGSNPRPTDYESAALTG